MAPAEQQLARRVFVRLVEPGDPADTRRRARIDELGGGRESAVLATLSAARLVTVDEGSVELAHEALIREWPRLRSWLDEDRDGLRLQRHVTSAATAWLALDRDDAELYRGPRLAAALDWLASDPDLSPVERQFLDASRAAADRIRLEQARTNRRLRLLLVAAVVALLCAMAAGATGFALQRRASDARDRADVSRLAAIAQDVGDQDPDLALLLAAEAHGLRDDEETRGALLGAIERHPQLAGLVYGTGSGLEAAVFSADGRLLAAPTSDGSGTLLWDTSTRRQVGALRDGNDILLGAAMSPDGRYLVVPAIRETSDDVVGRLQIWDLDRRELVRVVASPAGALTSAAFSSDGTVLVTQGGPRSGGPFPTMAVIWDPRTWLPAGEPWELLGDYVGDRKIAMSPDGTLLAAPTLGGDVLMWRVDDRSTHGGAIHATALAGGGAREVTALAFSPDAAALAVGVDTGAILLIDTRSGTRRASTIEQGSAATSLEWSHDGGLLAAGRLDGRTQLFDPEGTPLGLPLSANGSQVNDVTFSRDGSLLAIAGQDRSGALWTLDGRRAIGTPLRDQTGAITQTALTPDGTSLLTGSTDGSVAWRDPESGDVRHRVQVPGEVLTMAVDFARGCIAVGGTAGDVRVFSGDGQPERVLEVGDAWVLSVAVDPGTGVIAIVVDPTNGGTRSGGIGHVRFWDPATNTETGVRITIDKAGAPTGVAYRPDGSELAVGSDNNLLGFYDSRTHAAKGDPIDIPDDRTASLAYSPDGAKIATGLSSGTVRQWSVATHREVSAPLVGHHGVVSGIAYSADGSTLATTTLGLAATRLWNALTGAAIGGELVAGPIPTTERTLALEHFVTSRPSFSADGNHLVTAGPDGAAALWDLRPATWVRAACAIAGRDLTEQEWHRYLPDRTRHQICAAPR